MKKHIRLVNLLKLIIAGIAIALSSSYLNAWTISILNPSAMYDAGYHLLDGSRSTILSSYLYSTGSDFASGNLSNYSVGDSDAVIINLPPTGYSYTQAEKNVLNDLLNSNTRVLIFAENSSWATSNSELANILGGTYTSSVINGVQTVNPDLYPLLTEGVENVNFASPGKIVPKEGSGGISISSDSSVTLWGDNYNFLLFADVNAMEDSYINTYDNNQLALNIVEWLAGNNPNIPEPSSYAFISGTAILGLMAARRKRK